MRYLAILLMLSLSVIAPADDTIDTSVAIVFDLSHSMGIVDSGTTSSRLRLGVESLKRLFDGMHGESVEWALIIADDHSTAAVASKFSRTGGKILSALEDAAPWGVTSLASMMESGSAYLSEGAGGNQKYLLLVSDCINTYGDLYALPDLEFLEGQGIVPLVLGFPVSEYPGFSSRASAWVGDSGGAFYFHDQISQLRRTIEQGIPAIPVPVPSIDVEPTETVYSPILFPIWWIFLIPLVVLGVFLGILTARWLKERGVQRALPTEKTTAVHISVSVYGRETEERVFEAFPIKVAAAGKADLVLAQPKISAGARTFSIVDDGGDALFLARGMFVINGVGRKSVHLKVGDRISFGRYRIEYGGTSHHTTPPPSVPAPRPLFLAPLLLIFAALSVLFRDPVEIRVPERHDRNVAADPVEEPNTAGEAPAVPRDITGFPTVMWDPAVTPDYFKLDALFIHAHPDDESLDFGVLISRLTDSGKKVGVVLLTDGDSGLDQYPERSVGGPYPAYDLTGDALAAVRRQEALGALRVLGVHHYVRLGLKNHPYTGGLDVLSPGRVIAAWGGEEVLVERLSQLIAGYRPEIVISPEGPSAAFEHFEHEATGILVRKALGSLDSSSLPSGWLVSVDPLQKSSFDDAVGVRADGMHRQSGLVFRAVQAAALAEHRTQRDAAVIGVENLSNFAVEYYRVLKWDFDVSIEEYLLRRGGHQPL